MVKVEKIEVIYPDGYEAVKGINFQVEEHQSVAIIGSNGAGKSTLLRAMMGLIPLRSGQIWISDILVEKKNYPQIRKEAGMIFQNPDDQIFNTRVMDDIMYGPKNAGVPEKEIEERVNSLIKDLKMEEISKKLTHKLSGGEKRLVTIAGILAMEPKVLLMDEPTGFLDPRARRSFIELIGQIDYTKIMVTHDLDLVLELCDRVILVDNGQIVAEGMPDELLRNQNLLEKHGLELPLCFQTPRSYGIKKGI